MVLEREYCPVLTASMHEGEREEREREREERETERERRERESEREARCVLASAHDNKLYVI